MDRLTRKELKKDSFALEVGHTVEFMDKHRKQIIVYGVAAVAVILIVAGLFYYNRREQTARQEALRAALNVMSAPVTAEPVPAGVLAYATPDEKTAATSKALTDLAAKYPRSDEAAIAEYYLATIAVSQNRLEEAAKRLGEVAGSGKTETASLANYTLAQVYVSQGKTAEAEKLLRALVAQPTIMVPKEESTIALARLIAASNPEEAKKLLEPLRTVSGPVGRAALSAYSELFVQN